MVAVARDRDIVRDRPDRLEFFIDAFQVAVLARPHIGVAAEAHVDRLVGALDLPGEAVAQPRVGQFDLLAVDDALVEEAVLVADAAPVPRQLQGRHGIDEARRQAPQAAVAQARVRLHGDDVVQVEAQIGQGAARQLLHMAVQQVRVQQPSQQELDAEIIDLLRLFRVIAVLRGNPVRGDQVLHHVGQDLVDLFLRQTLRRFIEEDVRFLGEQGLEFSLAFPSFRFDACFPT